MNDIYTVLRKELLELFGDRQSFRGPLVQGGILLLLAGILVPALDESIWSGTTAPVVLFQLLPAAVASMIAADAFAGERERRTLETLLATPLPESALFIGKTLSAVTFALLLTVATLTSATVVASIRFGPQLLPPLTLASVIAGSIAASLFTSSIAVILSSRMDVARSAQQAASMASMLLLFGAAALIEKAGPMTAGALLRAEAVIIAVAVGMLTLAARAFRRDRLFG